MKYDILCDAFLDDLIKSVNEKLKKGWKCQGGVAHNDTSTSLYRILSGNGEGK